MAHGDSTWGSNTGDSHEARIRAARAQIEAVRHRLERLGTAGRKPRLGFDDGPRAGAVPGYRLLHEVHRGGQGVVYLAVQASTGRRVAVKVLSRTGSAAGLVRFEREVEALSALKHPNIVTIHDCGRDHDHVYLVMDYIDGRPLDVYVAAEQPPLRDTVALIARICEAVNAAHLRGVIHRDLKPANILVDEQGEPRVLDFGLAKLIGDPSSGGISIPAMTMTGQFVGSLPWASPEQADGRGVDVDIRSDVYSLGVVLFQVLTGRFPYDVSVGFAEVARHIVHTPPVRPSTINAEIDRELETIILRCLAKEPERRYQSAGELARDLRRYLAGDPIEARRDSPAYILAKRLARYRVAAIAAAASLVLVSGALAVSLTLWRRAERNGALAALNAQAAQAAAARADREANEARAVTAFVRELLMTVDPEKEGADVRLTQVLARASAAASQRFATHPLREAEVRGLLGQVYDKLSLWGEGVPEVARAFEIMNRHAGPDDPRTLELEGLYAHMLINAGRTAELDEVLADLVPRTERLFGPDDSRTLVARRHLALSHLFRGRHKEAERILLELRAHPTFADDLGQLRILPALVATQFQGLEDVEPAARAAALARGEALALEWTERAARAFGPGSVSTAQARVKWASFAVQAGHSREAAETCREILALDPARLGECHSIRAEAMYILAEALHLQGNETEPATLHLRRLACLRGQIGAGRVYFLAGIGDALRYIERAGLGPEGEALANELADALREFGGGHGDMLLVADMYAAAFISMQGRLEEADARFRALLAQEALIFGDRGRARLHLFHGLHLARRGDFEAAERALKHATTLAGDLRTGTLDTHPDDLILGFMTLYTAWNRPDEAEKYRRLREAVRAR